jgi:UDP:flavonoid glycosyltransferase YjiC (YdhE family)
VLVGLSTSNQNQVPLLQRLCDALGTLDVEALVTTGPAVAPDALRPAANTTVLQFVSHDRVLPSADLLVTHAGHGTVMAGATYGVPMLCLPMGRDQPMNAARVAQLGLGRVVDADAPVAEIRGAIADALGDAAMKKRAKDFAASVASHRGLDDAVALVEKLLPNRT